jgi:hypothetical protein
MSGEVGRLNHMRTAAGPTPNNVSLFFPHLVIGVPQSTLAKPRNN